MTLTRTVQAVAGLTFATIGITGLATVVSQPASATEGRDRHEVMHRMMEAMHGEAAVERLHAVDGAEDMMERCDDMMDATNGMSGMMDGPGMSGMVDR